MTYIKEDIGKARRHATTTVLSLTDFIDPDKYYKIKKRDDGVVELIEMSLVEVK